MKKGKYWILIVIVIAIIVWGLSSVMGTVIIKYAGKKVIAVITEVPSECDRYNHIRVLLDSAEYEVRISRINCSDGIYKEGQRVVLVKHKNYKELVWPNSHPELGILLVVAVLIYVYLTARKRYRK